MCHFITAVLPVGAAHAEIDRLARGYGRQFQSLDNLSIESWLESDERYFFTTLGHCDCGTPLGSHDRQMAQALDWTAEERRLLKKGWSRAKVARSLEQKREHLDSDTGKNARANAKAMASWVDLIEAVLDSGLTQYLGLLIHFYDGPLDEQIELIGRVDVSRGEAQAEYLAGMKEDTLYIFQR